MSGKLVSRIRKILLSGGSSYRTLVKRMEEISTFPPNEALLPTLRTFLSLSHMIKLPRHQELVESLCLSLRKRCLVSSKELYDTSLDLIFRIFQINRRELDFFLCEFVLNQFTFSATLSCPESQRVEKLSFQWSHRLLSKMLKQDSRCFVRLPKCVVMSFPKEESTIREHMDFTTHVLKICLSCQRIQKPILESLIDQLIQMDLKIKIQDYYKNKVHGIPVTPEDPGTDDTETITDEDNQEDIEKEIFNHLSFEPFSHHYNITNNNRNNRKDDDDDDDDDDMDDDGNDRDNIQNDGDLEKLMLHRNEKMILISEKVDYTMETLFEYINFCATKRRNLMNTLFEHLQEIFFSQILKTYQLNSTQFLMFYISSKRGVVITNNNNMNNMNRNRNMNHGNNNLEVETFIYSQKFVQELLKWGIRTENLHIEVKKCCVAYLGSFLARAKFIPPPFILKPINELCDFCIRIIRTKSSSFSSSNYSQPFVSNNYSGNQKDSMFYFVCQCVFYVLCYRFSRQLLGHPLFHQMNLMTKMEEIITSSRYDPFRYLPFDIVGTIYQYFSSLQSYDIRIKRITSYIRKIIEQSQQHQHQRNSNEEEISSPLFSDDDEDDYEIEQKHQRFSNRQTGQTGPPPPPPPPTRHQISPQKENVHHQQQQQQHHKSRVFLSSDYFPFDPYILRRSKRFIEPIFLEWTLKTPVLGIEKDQKQQQQMIESDSDDDNLGVDEDEEEEDEDEIGIDDFLKEIGRSDDDDDDEDEIVKKKNANNGLASSPTLSDYMNEFVEEEEEEEDIGKPGAYYGDSIEDIFGVQI